MSATTQMRTVRPYVVDQTFNNAIRTSKYRWWSFIPLNLYEQFHNLANIYFFVVMCLQMVTAISITAGKPLIGMPLLFVLAVSAAKDLWEDLARSAADAGENTSTTHLTTGLNDGPDTGSTITWAEVRVGHVLSIRKGERFPADMCLVESSDVSTCNVETVSLDGETNLKQKMSAIPEDMPWSTLVQTAHIEYEQPSAELYEFKGAIVQNEPNGVPPRGIGINGLLLRGTSLQHTEWVKGLVVYCGHDTRVMKNSQGSRFKCSMLDEQMNTIMIFVFVAMLILSCSGGLLFTIWETRNKSGLWYLRLLDSSTEASMLFLISSGTWALQLGNMVPISLMVTLTTVKFLQGKLIEMDDTCKDPKTNTFAEAHTSQVLESLGQITHVFSDKTGTLTCNEMVYKSCSVGSVIYGTDHSEGRVNSIDNFVDFDAGTQQILRDLSMASLQDRLAGFLLCHALCHTVTVDTSAASTSAEGAPPRPAYAASSPDELALVSAARVIGLGFFEGTQAHMTLHVTEKRLHAALEKVCGSAGKPVDGSYNSLTFDLLAVCDFDNDRKRMSVVVKYPNGELVLFVKGADSSILPYTAPQDQKIMSDHLSFFSKNGLRTLCLGLRKLDLTEFEEWNVRYRAALSSLSDDRAMQVHKLCDELETKSQLETLGSTAIEDRLQEGVPEAIERLRLAGITVWVLTGDKMETAINIGMSSKLLTESMVNTVVDGEVAEIRKQLNQHIDDRQTEAGKAITVTGASLALVLADRDLTDKFYKACLDCQSVLACRVSPQQKANVVKLAKTMHYEFTRVQPVTLAIGDGANDVAMITAAHVGVGLSGKEGAQAARAADFAFGQFRFLTRLLFVHGREAYRRNAVLVNYNFYKNLVLVLPPFMYGPMMAFSGQPFYDQSLYQLYNVIFSAFPIIVYALLDRPCAKLSDLEVDPSLYGPGIRKEFFNRKVFFLWVFTAFMQAIWLTVLALVCFSDDGMYAAGSAVFFWVVIGVNLTITRRSNMLFLFTAIVVVGSVVSYPVCLEIVESIGAARALTSETLFSLRAWLMTLLFVGGFLAIGEPIFTLVEDSRHPSSKALDAKGAGGEKISRESSPNGKCAVGALKSENAAVPTEPNRDQVPLPNVIPGNVLERLRADAITVSV
eukprot:TRINITY_DN17260_c0_g1_i1.p1 TRINITY_DN17260_c0_g1~~TRINITY_DN17260_c0_g1_i1.p1  ORF type:complete len:1161 (+),score=171.12 TRINITY_DN17260_c0_g1_i1:74-3484(+)